MPLTQEQKDKRNENLKGLLTPDFFSGIAQAATSIGTSVADTVRDQKIKKEQTKATLKDIKSGGSVSASSSTQTQAPSPSASGSDTILGMSKPIFFGGVGVLVLVAGVGIFLATRSSSAAPAQ